MSGTEILKTLPQGETVDIIAETDGWYKVRDKNGAVGWSGASLIQTISASTINNRLDKEHFTLGVNKGYTQGEKTKIIDRVRGYILLQVEKNGEAFYISPRDTSVHYLQNGSEAYRIMRELGLGISNFDLEVINIIES